jgi:hypothetical protein
MEREERERERRGEKWEKMRKSEEKSRKSEKKCQIQTILFVDRDSGRIERGSNDNTWTYGCNLYIFCLMRKRRKRGEKEEDGKGTGKQGEEKEYV